jgi:hypothetical protein
MRTAGWWRGDAGGQHGEDHSSCGSGGFWVRRVAYFKVTAQNVFTLMNNKTASKQAAFIRNSN